MKKQSAAGLFFSILLKAVVIILGLVIIGFGIFFIIKVAKTDKKNDAPATTVSDNVLTEVEAHDDLLYETATEATEAPLPEEQEPAAGTSYNKNAESSMIMDILIHRHQITPLLRRLQGL